MALGFKEDRTANEQKFPYQERKRWRESTLWGESPLEETKYYVSEKVPGRNRGIFMKESPHYEPPHLVVNGITYQPKDRRENVFEKDTN